MFKNPFILNIIEVLMFLNIKNFSETGAEVMVSGLICNTDKMAKL